MSYLLDTNVISELSRKLPAPQVVHWIDSRDPQRLYLSAITIGEIRRGIALQADVARKVRLEEWLVNALLPRFSGRILSIDVEVMLTWGVLAAQAKRTLPAFDSLIAALARHHNFQLVTRNEADFADMGVSVINPWRVAG